MQNPIPNLLIKLELGLVGFLTKAQGVGNKSYTLIGVSRTIFQVTVGPFGNMKQPIGRGLPPSRLRSSLGAFANQGHKDMDLATAMSRRLRYDVQ